MNMTFMYSSAPPLATTFPQMQCRFLVKPQLPTLV
jgi:hypothetical protein